MRTNRRGQTAIDLMLMLIVLVVFALSIVFGYKILGDFNTEFQADTAFSNTSKENLQSATTQFPLYFDNGFIFILMMLWVTLIVTSFMVDTHPIFLGITILLLIFVFVIAMSISNTYQEVTADSEFSTAADQFPKMNWVINNLLMVAIVYGLSAALALFAKSQL